MKERIEEIKKVAKEKIGAIANLQEIQELKVKLELELDLEKIDVTLPSKKISGYNEEMHEHKAKTKSLEDRIRAKLLNMKLSEISTSEFMNVEDLDKINVTEDSDLRIKIIKSEDNITAKKTTTLPNILQVLKTSNRNEKNTTNIFEISKIYKADGKNEIQEEFLTIALYGRGMDFYKLKFVVEKIMEEAFISDYDFLTQKTNNSYHPGKAAKIMIEDEIIAELGEVHPEVLVNYGFTSLIKRVYIAEISIDKLKKYSKKGV